MVRPVDTDRITVFGGDDEYVVIHYDAETKRMKDIVAIDEVRERPKLELLDAKSRELLPPLYHGEERTLEAVAPVKFFTPDAQWTWYASEFDGEDMFFGLVNGFELEFGYFSLSELEETRGALGLPIERDRFYEPKTLQELLDMHTEQRRKGDI